MPPRARVIASFALLGGAAALFGWACDSFDSDTGGGGFDASVDAPSASDAGGGADAGPDRASGGDASGEAGLGTIPCGADEKCQAGAQICCIWEALGVVRTACIDGPTCPGRTNDAGEPLRAHALECDDTTDCLPGRVCCFRGVSACTSVSLAKAECVAPSACTPCAADGGNGRLGCDKQSLDPNECPTGRACNGTIPGPFPYPFCN